MIFDSDDFGASHIISEMTQSHDCRDALNTFKKENPKFKATLFTIPSEITVELLSWSAANRDWIELAWHGFYHQSNYECEKMTYEEFDSKMKGFEQLFGPFFVKGFKAPGWQISDDVYKWLLENGYWVADQGYNDKRRPKELAAYVNYDGEFKVYHNGIPSDTITASHHHTWDCMGNGVYEQGEEIIKRNKDVKEFKFVSEIIDETNPDKKRSHDNG